eukprot:m51a1_g231 putative type iii restriction res subunit (1635) ;mRNA; f:106029-114610
MVDPVVWTKWRLALACALLLWALPGHWAVAAAAPEAVGGINDPVVLEAYDAPPYRPVTVTVTTQTHHPCRGSDDKYRAGQWAQLFTPREVPWAYTGVSFAVVNRAGDGANATVRGAVDLYAAELSDRMLVPGDLLASVSFAPRMLHEQDVPEWVAVDLRAAFVAWSRGVFIGVRWWSCQKVGMVVSRGLNVGRLVYIWREEYRDWQLCHNSSRTNGLTRALALRATGKPHRPAATAAEAVPPTWVCSRSEYGDSVCSCNCGAWDPACTLSPRSPNCSAHSICDSSARCTSPGWERGRCEERRYWAYDGCQCECGGDTDPDCFDPFATVSACHEPHALPQCTESAHQAVCKETWHCDESRYNDGHVCDCDCGEIDPDCERLSVHNTTCPAGWKCFEGACSVPVGWTCSDSNYNDRIVCDCNCGVYDPDCDMKLPVDSCSEGQVCGYDAHCTWSGCGNNHTEMWEHEVSSTLCGLLGFSPVHSREKDCDGGPNCQENCTCRSGYAHLGWGCVAPEEECDSSAFCTASCMCQPGHALHNGRCQGCGNGAIDGAEKCDGGLGCGGNCTCLEGFVASVRPSPDCVAVARADTRRAAAVSAGVGGPLNVPKELADPSMHFTPFMGDGELPSLGCIEDAVRESWKWSQPPHPHQIEALASLMGEVVSMRRASRSFLVHHAPGTGKASSVACLASLLCRLRADDRSGPVFSAVVIVADRSQLESHLLERVTQFLAENGIYDVVRPKDAPSLACVLAEIGSRPAVAAAPAAAAAAAPGDAAMAEAEGQLPEAPRVVVTTLRRFAMLQGPSAPSRVAVIADDADFCRARRRKPHEVLETKTWQQHSVVYVSFASAVTTKTLEKFGERKDESGLVVPFHSYPLNRAVSDGVVHDVFRNYMYVGEEAFLEGRSSPSGPQKKKRNTSSPQLAEKAEYIMRHFVELVSLVDNDEFKAMAMVVAGSNKQVIWYVRAFRRIVDALPQDKRFGVIGSFHALEFEGKRRTERDTDVNGEYARMCSRRHGIVQASKDPRTPVRVIVTYDKHTTCLDEPRLAVMYIDTKMHGSEALQTLSRLNRVAPGKREVFVVDFATRRDEQLKSCAPYMTEAQLKCPGMKLSLELRLKGCVEKLAALEGFAQGDLSRALESLKAADAKAKVLSDEVPQFLRLCDKLQVDSAGGVGYEFVLRVKESILRSRTERETTHYRGLLESVLGSPKVAQQQQQPCGVVQPRPQRGARGLSSSDGPARAGARPSAAVHALLALEDSHRAPTPPMEFAKRLWAAGAADAARSNKRALLSQSTSSIGQFFTPAEPAPLPAAVAAILDERKAAPEAAAAADSALDVGAAVTLLQSPAHADRKRALSVLCTRLLGDSAAVSEFVDKGGAETLAEYVRGFATSSGAVQSAHVAGALKLLAAMSAPEHGRLQRVQLAFRTCCGAQHLVDIVRAAAPAPQAAAADPKLESVWPSIRSLAAKAVGALCYRNSVNRKAAIAAGAVEALAALLGAAAAALVPSDDQQMDNVRAAQMASNAANALASLCCEPLGASVAARTRCAQTLAAIMTSPKCPGLTVASCAHCLVVLVSTSEDVKKALQATQALDGQLERLLERAPQAQSKHSLFILKKLLFHAKTQTSCGFQPRVPQCKRPKKH